jgi:lipoprotein-anchoring transpeptidase ErfK/SrfK
MKLAALTFLIFCNLAASQACAEDVFVQPLTRVHCDEAGMAWDENANVCVANSGLSGQPLTRLDCVEAGMAWNDNANVCGTAQAVETILKPEAPDSSSQPLTRNECDMAGMRWNDQANVCSESAGSAAQAATIESSLAASTVLINIDKTRQRMMVLVDGAERYDWPVSTGLPGYATPPGTYTASSMNEMWYSRQWDDAPMPHAVFFTKEGHAIHGTNEVKRLGKPASHGCVRLSPENAATLYDLVARNGLENTQVVLSGLTPGGEGKVASPGRSKSQYRRAARNDDSYTKPRRRGGLFRRLFGRR